MEKKDVINFFDHCASWWDADMVRNEAVIASILDNGGIREGLDVLDVACGTGVLFPDYLNRKVASLTGIDISPEMVKIAQGKFPNVQVICGDVETAVFERKFDAIMVYNAFPHFPDPAHLIEVLANLLKPGGRLSIAHGMSRAALTDHHKRATAVSLDLPEAGELASLLNPYFEVDLALSNSQMYQVTGIRRGGIVHSHGGHSHTHAHPHQMDETPLDETLALMKFMVQHNDSHAQELAELACQLQASGESTAYRKIMDAVSTFDMANATLDAVLHELTLHR